MKKTIQLAVLAGLTLFTSGTALAITDSGNTLALDIVTAKTPDKKAKLMKDAVGTLYYFRYLKILEMNDSTTNGDRRVHIRAIEPSSDVIVEFTAIKSVSLKILDRDPKTQLGDAIGATGRIESIAPKGTNLVIAINPVIINHKDKLAPVRGKELLYEIDPNARLGTDTSSGKIIKIPAK